CFKNPDNYGNNYGLGLTAETMEGLHRSNISTVDQQALSQAFMLNQGGSGSIIDPVASSNNGPYQNCLNVADTLLHMEGISSEVCLAYIADANFNNDDPGGAHSTANPRQCVVKPNQDQGKDAEFCSDNSAPDYYLQFFDCKSSYANGLAMEDM
ncbi:MAG: hypothetical protein HQL13_02560, partial [Candidatus Omnitrophica bacterium]|nr:hypothetical protein [Candidatus Omnitrophota bacterium]